MKRPTPQTLARVTEYELDYMVCWSGYVFTDTPSAFRDVFTDGERFAVWRLDRPHILADQGVRS